MEDEGVGQENIHPEMYKAEAKIRLGSPLDSGGERELEVRPT